MRPGENVAPRRVSGYNTSTFYSMSLEIALVCDLLLDVLPLEHGVPQLWARTRPAPNLESQYRQLHAELGAEVNKLVALNKKKQLLAVSAAEIRAQTQVAVESAGWTHVARAQLAEELRLHAQVFRAQSLDVFLAAALPVLRATYHGNGLLTDSEFAVLNNLKKLYSQYNAHAGNVARAVRGSRQLGAAAEARAAVAGEVEQILRRMEQLVETWRALHADQQVVRNTLANLGAARTDAAERMPEAAAKVAALAREAARRAGAAAVVCDFVPALVLCQAASWYDDEGLRAAVEECQAVGEGLRDAGFGAEGAPDFAALAAACDVQLAPDT